MLNLIFHPYFLLNMCIEVYKIFSTNLATSHKFWCSVFIILFPYLVSSLIVLSFIKDLIDVFLNLKSIGFLALIIGFYLYCIMIWKHEPMFYRLLIILYMLRCVCGISYCQILLMFRECLKTMCILIVFA